MLAMLLAGILEKISEILSAAGQQVWLPIFLFVIALIFRAKSGRALRAAITIGVGWIGLLLVFDLFFGTMVPASQAMVNRTGLQFTAVDVGWPIMAAIAYGTLVGAAIIPIGILVNIILLAARLTRTFDIDVWNFWHWAFVGGTVYTLTQNLPFAFLAAITYEVMCLKVGDWTVKPLWDLFPGYKGYSIPQGGGWVGSIPFIAIFKPLVDSIPTPKADPETVREKLGVLGEPLIIGLVLGAIIAILAGYGPLEIAKVAMASAAVMELLPRIIGIIMEGLRAIADAVTEYMRTRFPGKEIYIGMDAAIAIGHPTTVAAGLILIPLVLLIAAIFPGIDVLPYADLAATPFFVVAAVPFFKGDLIKSTIMGTILMIIWQHLGSWWVPIFTETAKSIGAIAPDAAPIGCIWLQPMIPVAVIASKLPEGANYLLLIVIIGIFLFADRIKSLKEAFSKLYK